MTTTTGMQVVRATVRFDDEIETRIRNGHLDFWHEDEQQWFSLGDVIELTEEQADDSTEHRGLRRWVSGWEVADGAVDTAIADKEDLT